MGALSPGARYLTAEVSRVRLQLWSLQTLRRQSGAWKIWMAISHRVSVRPSRSCSKGTKKVAGKAMVEVASGAAAVSPRMEKLPMAVAAAMLSLRMGRALLVAAPAKACLHRVERAVVLVVLLVVAAKCAGTFSDGANASSATIAGSLIEVWCHEYSSRL